jgi:Escherichia/Staphylococcus phage prohead protease
MSEATQDEQATEAPERALLVREFPAEITAGDGRTVDVRVVPYGVQANVSDGGPVYREEWLAGCFDEQLRAANRVNVLLNFEHQAGIAGIVGRGVDLRSEADGLHGTFRMLNTQDGDKALELVNEGVLGGVSLEAYGKKSIRSHDGVVKRVKAHLDKVALCRRPAFKDAVVLAIREEVIFDEELLPIEIDPELVERCRRLGIKLPESMKAHPDETGTPAETGTPERGTRQEEEPDLPLEV